MERRIKFIGLDVHKETIAVAVAEDGRDGEIRFHGTIANTAEAVRRLVTRLGGPGIELRFCYEAGPFGLGLHRQLRKLGADCLVISPSTMPRRPGDRVKTDRRDAVTMAKLLRAGELAGIWIPDEEHEAIRDLVRARRTAKDDLKRAKLGLLSFMLRHERRFGGRSHWTKAHRRWLGEQTFESPHQQLVVEELKQRIREGEARCQRLEAALAEAVGGWRMAPLVRALQGLRGLGLVASTVLVAEVGDLRRFANPKQLMAWLGLVPGEHSSGNRTRRGGITRAGNAQARTILIEAGWCYRHKAREERRFLERCEGLPAAIRAVGWKAQVRLCQRFRRMSAAGKPLPKVTTAIARELAGFVWDIARRIEPAPAG